MPVNDELGKRMKENYENISRIYLTRKVPVAIRIDGKAFHTFTQGFKRPFDDLFAGAMQETMKYLCENIQGCVFGYTQSDEITLILIDYQKLDSDAWFGYNLQKMCSVSASMATMCFNRIFRDKAYSYHLVAGWNTEEGSEDQAYKNALNRANMRGAMFDARAFNIPKEEVANLIYWRQLDAQRNSIQMAGQAYFSHKELDGKSQSNIQDMLMEQHHVNWNNYPTWCKRGAACVKVVSNVEVPDPKNGVFIQREKWVIDREMPMVRDLGRVYVNKRILYKE